MTPIKVAKNPANGPSTIPVIGSIMKFQLYQTPEGISGILMIESETTFRAEKIETRTTNWDVFFLLLRRVLF